jgi:hypothetical protein
LESVEILKALEDVGISVERWGAKSAIVESPKSARQARRSFFIRIFSCSLGSVESEGTYTALTDPLQLPVDEVEAVKVFQPMCDIYQLRKPVRYGVGGGGW